MSPEVTDIRVHLMIVFAVQALEAVRAGFTLFGFESGQISLEVHFVTPSKMSMMLDFVGAVAFNIP